MRSSPIKGQPVVERRGSPDRHSRSRSLACSRARSLDAPAGDRAQGGGKGTVAITTRAAAPGMPTRWPEWIVIIDVSVGPGRDSVTFLVNPNFGAARSGEMRIAGYTFKVDQGGCTYVVNPTKLGCTRCGEFADRERHVVNGRMCLDTDGERSHGLRLTVFRDRAVGAVDSRHEVEGFISGTLTRRGRGWSPSERRGSHHADVAGFP